MHKKFEINRTKIRGSCQSGSKVVTHNSKSDLPLVFYCNFPDLLCIRYAHAFWDGTNSGLSKTALYAIIGASAGVVLIILIVVIVCVCKNKYSEVSQNP